jgi:homoaconitase/3-isopropylmalate dehydratase large subunit
VRAAAEREGLHEVFAAAGFEWRGRLFDVPRDEHRPGTAGKSRIVIEPQFRGRQGSPTAARCR